METNTCTLHVYDQICTGLLVCVYDVTANVLQPPLGYVSMLIPGRTDIQFMNLITRS